MMYLFAITLMMILVKYLNRLRVSNKQLRLQNKFLKLHGELRSLIYAGKVDAEDSAVQYLDSMINGSAKILGQINFWVIVYLAYKLRKHQQPNYSEFEKSFTHPEVRKIFHAYQKESVIFFHSKNFFAMKTFKFCLQLILLVTTLFHRTRGRTFRQNFKKYFKYWLLDQESQRLQLCVNENAIAQKVHSVPQGIY